MASFADMADRLDADADALDALASDLAGILRLAAAELRRRPLNAEAVEVRPARAEVWLALGAMAERSGVDKDLLQKWRQRNVVSTRKVGGEYRWLVSDVMERVQGQR